MGQRLGTLYRAGRVRSIAPFAHAQSACGEGSGVGVPPQTPLSEGRGSGACRPQFGERLNSCFSTSFIGWLSWGAVGVASS
jgi:hypothetical protein